MTTTLSPEVVQKLVSEFKGFSPSGISCKYIKIDEKWGLKIYFKQHTRDAAYNGQSKAAAHGLAPEVGDKFDIGRDNFCYITENVDTLVKGNSRDEWMAHYNILSNNEVLCEDIRDVVEEMNIKIGWYMDDAHVGNFGKKDGKMVCIDFGDYYEAEEDE